MFTSFAIIEAQKCRKLAQPSTTARWFVLLKQAHWISRKVDLPVSSMPTLAAR